MNAENNLSDLKALNQEIKTIWNQNAEFWDEYMKEGNDFQRILIGPVAERLLDLKPGEQVLEVACGNGSFTRRMAQLGAHIVASDFSERFIERAKAKSTEFTDHIEYSIIDATDEEQLLSLGRRRFDAAYCGMALMDMAMIDPLMRALSQILKVGGRFVFSVTHPCFNSPGTSKLSELTERDGQVLVTHSIRVNQYLGLEPEKGIGISGQPVPHYYIPRSLSALFNVCFSSGLVMDGLEEPAFDPQEISMPAEQTFHWRYFQQISPVLITRLRVV
jgi:2-polyprenyl-3-methyl-5-hydroxy-6-metoxy-1,4-benzoquinol methylase